MNHWKEYRRLFCKEIVWKRHLLCVAFSLDGRFVLTASLDSSAVRWLTNKP